MAVEKIKILGAVLEVLAKQHCQELGQNGLYGQCCLAGSSMILIFSTAMGAKPSLYMKFIAM